MQRMSAKEVERRLGLQYAQVLKEGGNHQFVSVYRDCEEVIQGSLDMLERYNRIAMTMKTKTRQVAGVFS